LRRKDAANPLELHFFSLPSRTYFSGQDIPGSKNLCCRASPGRPIRKPTKSFVPAKNPAFTHGSVKLLRRFAVDQFFV
jgi:hypothetical protein